MTRNMGRFDRGLRAFVVAPAAVVVAVILGAGTLGGTILFVFAGINLATAATAFCPTYTRSGSLPIRMDCIASAVAFASATPSPPRKARSSQGGA